MTQYLFGAEADSIQETVFQGASQREVIGGSRLLALFGDVATQYAQEFGATEEQILAAAGGQFRLLFDDKKKAEQFGELLTNAYRHLLNGSITLAEIAEATDFKQAADKVFDSITIRKKEKRGVMAMPHSPTTAYSQSSGVGLANEVVSDSRTNPGQTRYWSTTEWAMKRTGEQTRVVQGADFLGSIANSIHQLSDNLSFEYGRIVLGWNGKPEEFNQELEYLRRRLDIIRNYPSHPQKPSDSWGTVDDLAGLDPLNNVAYLVADGNGMGELFGQCKTPAQYKALSQALDVTMREALAYPVPALLYRFPEFQKYPVLPLILAGDDCFAILPAKYALDYARLFCLAFERIIQTKLQQGELKGLQLPHQPTMSASVVIVKGNYPYRMAHKLGKSNQKRVKRLVKTSSPKTSRLSAVGYVIMLGNQIPESESPQSEYIPFQVYWAKSEAGLPDTTVPLTHLLESRIELLTLPNKRRSQLRDVYADENLPKEINQTDQFNQWGKRFDFLLRRLKATDKNHRDLTEEIVKKLGSVDPSLRYWKSIIRQGKEYRAQGMLDLLAIWDYAQQLSSSLEDYEGSEK